MTDCKDDLIEALQMQNRSLKMQVAELMLDIEAAMVDQKADEQKIDDLEEALMTLQEEYDDLEGGVVRNAN